MSHRQRLEEANYTLRPSAQPARLLEHMRSTREGMRPKAVQELLALKTAQKVSGIVARLVHLKLLVAEGRGKNTWYRLAELPQTQEPPRPGSAPALDAQAQEQARAASYERALAFARGAALRGRSFQANTQGQHP